MNSTAHSRREWLLVALGPCAATWLGVGAYWYWLRWTGEAPAYYVASMFWLRGLLTAPMQLAILCALVFVLRDLLLPASSRLLAFTCGLAALLALGGEILGSNRPDFLDVSPYFAGPTALSAMLSWQVCRRWSASCKINRDCHVGPGTSD